MKTVNPDFAAHLAGNVTTTATCWKITRRDGVVLGFTDHVKDLIVDGVRMVAASGYTRSAIAGNSSLSVDNVDLEGIITDAGITEEDCRNGVYDYAEVEMILVNFNSPDSGRITLRRGNLGELTLKDGIFVSEIRGLAQALTRNFMEVYTPDCSTEFGSTKCGVDLSLWTDSGEITSIITPRRAFGTDLQRASGWFTGGIITFTSGDAFGLSMEIKNYGSLTVPVGDTASITSWTQTNQNVYQTTPQGGPVTITTGALGKVTISAELSFTFSGDTSQGAYGQWQYKKTTDSVWTDVGTAEVYSSVLAQKNNKAPGTIAFNHSLSGLDPATDYEFRLRLRRATSGSKYLVFTGTATLSSDPPLDTGSTEFGEVTLFLPLSRAPAVGDTFDIVVGCDKTCNTCKIVFNNIANFRGYPHIPGMDKVIKTPEYKAAEVG